MFFKNITIGVSPLEKIYRKADMGGYIKGGGEGRKKAKNLSKITNE